MLSSLRMVLDGQSVAFVEGERLRQILEKLGYRRVPGRGHGSHEILRCEGRPPITWAHHNATTIPPKLVRSILIREVGLSQQEAKEVLGL